MHVMGKQIVEMPIFTYFEDLIRYLEYHKTGMCHRLRINISLTAATLYAVWPDH